MKQRREWPVTLYLVMVSKKLTGRPTSCSCCCSNIEKSGMSHEPGDDACQVMLVCQHFITQATFLAVCISLVLVRFFSGLFLSLPPYTQLFFTFQANSCYHASLLCLYPEKALLHLAKKFQERNDVTMMS